MVINVYVDCTLVDVACGERTHGGSTDIESRTGYPLEEGVDVPTSPLGSQSEAVGNFRYVGVTQCHSVVCVDYSISVDIPVAYITYAVGTEILFRGIVYLFLVLE